MRQRQQSKLLSWVGGLLWLFWVFQPAAALADINVNATKDATNYKYENVEGSIRAFLCTPDQGRDSQVLYTCINKLYRFGIAVGGFMVTFFLVLAGYFYLIGGTESKAKGKSILSNALVGLAILSFSYILLKFLNPSLVVFRPIQPPIFTADRPVFCTAGQPANNCILLDGTTPYSGDGTAGGSTPGPGKCEELTGSNGLVCKAGCTRSDKAQCHPQYDNSIKIASSKFGVDADFIRAKIQTESTWDEKATNSSGGQGLMQVTPVAIKDVKQLGDTSCDGNMQNPDDNIMCGTRYLQRVKQLLTKQFGSAVADDYRAQLAAYNGGYNKQKYQKDLCGDRFNFECPFTDSSKTACDVKKNKENMNHPVRVMEFYNQYKRLKCN